MTGVRGKRGEQQRIPWSAELSAWFSGNFRLLGPVSGYPGSTLYVRDS